MVPVTKVLPTYLKDTVHGTGWTPAASLGASLSLLTAAHHPAVTLPTMTKPFPGITRPDVCGISLSVSRHMEDTLT